MSSRPNRGGPADVVVGMLLAVAGVLVLSACIVAMPPTLYATGALALIGGAVGVVVSFLGRLRAGFYSEFVASTTLFVLGLITLRYSWLGANLLIVVAAFVFLVNGVARLASASEDAGLRGPLVLAGLVSLFVGGLVLAEVVAPTIVQFSVLVGACLLIDGLVSVAVGWGPRRGR
ncbi:DUF308 domain-containing protein [Nigerium massiliense]|uniref:DUF308 domain-containing protein n=1 Tax=Nigerium massiliense TaxID=1522317 RepID=UPI0005903D7D|nr:DUF308 domain-containing protein [Nigerium massiliense]